MDCQFTFDKGMENPPTSALFGPKFMEAIAYRHCQLEASIDISYIFCLSFYKMYVCCAGFGVGENVG